MKRCIIHVGAGKTGSSSIQSLLSSSKDEMKSQGFAYLGRMLEVYVDLQDLPRDSWQFNSGWPAWLASKGAATEAFVLRLHEQLDRLEKEGLHTVIISNEGLLDHVSAFRLIVKALAMRGIEVDILAVLRRHYEWAFSAYLQWGIRHKTFPGRTLSFRQWVSRRKPQFGKSLVAWRDCPGVSRLKLINYSAVPDVIPVFLDRIQLQLPYSRKKTRVNEAASAMEAFLLAIYNDHREGCVLPRETMGVLSRLKSQDHVMRHDSNHNWSETSEEDIHHVIELCRHDLNAVNELLRANGQPVFPDENKQMPSLPLSLTSLSLKPERCQEELLASMLSIIVSMDQQLQSQERQLSVLSKQLLRKRNED